jgi:hypothetical protein
VANLTRSIALIAACALVVACSGVDKQKFDAAVKAGKVLQDDVESTHGQVGPEFRDHLKQFDTEVSALQDKAIGRREVDAVKAYTEAADAYRYFLRFRALDLDKDSTQIQVKGPNLEVAERYKLPIDTRSGSKWINRAQAVTFLLQAGEQHLTDGNRLVNGQ